MEQWYSTLFVAHGVVVDILYKSSLVCLLCLPLPSLHLSDFLGNLFVLLVCVLFFSSVLYYCIDFCSKLKSSYFSLFLTILTYSSLHDSKYVLP